MQFQQLNRLGSFLELSASVRPSDTTDPLLKHSGFKEGVFMAHKTVRKTYTRLFSRPFDERVVVEIEYFDRRVWSLGQSPQRSARR